MVLRAFAARWSVVALMGLSISFACVEVVPGEPREPSKRDGARETARVSSRDEAGMTPELRAAYIEAVQSGAGEIYRAVREASGAARFVHRSQGFEASINGAEVRIAPQEAGRFELSLATTGVGCEGGSELGVPAGAAEIAGNRVEIARGRMREWYVNGPLGLEQGFTLERAPSCEGTKVVSIEVGGSVAPELVDEDGDGMGESVAFVDSEGAAVARYTDLFVKDATGKRLPAWMRVAAGRISLHVDDADAAYPVQIDPLVWLEQAKLAASDGSIDDHFGASVALSGDTALVGAYWADVGATVNQGAAYVFTRTGGVWTEQQKLTASDGAMDDIFGVSVALSGDTVLVGAAGADVGAAVDQGAAYVFTRAGGVWTEQQKLTASDGATEDYFGTSVALSLDTALVGSQVHDIGANIDQGAAYVFTLSGGVWIQQQKLTAGDGAAQEYFGGSVALSGDTALVSMAQGDVGANSIQGRVYVFTRSGGAWTQQQKLTAADGAAVDQFGISVALSGDTALVGALGDNFGASTDQGSAYVLVLGPPRVTGDACAAGIECESGFCVDGVCCDAACGVGLAGDCQACSVAAGAAVDGTCALLSMGTECRAAAGACDVAESCDGASGACPADATAAAGTECRAALGACDAAEACDGASVDCPGDVSSPDGATCDGGTCLGGTCVGSGGSGGEGGSSDPPVAEPSGCDCRVAGTTSGETSYAALSLLGVALLGMRRRRARRA
jgi:MYXO-CTERM domain-containing protein